MRTRPVLPSLLALAAALACRQAPPAPPPPAPIAVENASLGLRFASLPDGIRVAENRAGELAFDVLTDGVPGNLVVGAAAVPAAGVDLVGEAKAFGEAAGAAPGGRFFGGTQLVTPYGIAYTARALVDGGTMEERRIFLVHPGDPYRLVTFVLRYPPSDPEAANARLRHALELLAALEPLAPPAAPAAEPAPAPR